MFDGISEKLETPEIFNPKSVAVVTATYCPDWYPGEPRQPLAADKLRGNLAIQSAQAAKKQGFQIIFIDGSGNESFRKELEKLGVNYQSEREPLTQGSARRQGLEIVQSLGGVKIICETEPEKASMIADCLKFASQPIATGEADIVVPKRTEESFSTLPSYQAKAEKRANQMYNQLLRAHGLLKPEDPDIDFWFGVRVFANRPEIVKLFKKRYEFSPSGLALHKIIRSDAYSNPLEFPVVNALHDGLRVKSVEIPYVHSWEQTEFEEGKEEFNRKRDVQRRAIVTELLHFIRYLEENQKTRISEKQL